MARSRQENSSPLSCRKCRISRNKGNFSGNINFSYGSPFFSLPPLRARARRAFRKTRESNDDDSIAGVHYRRTPRSEAILAKSALAIRVRVVVVVAEPQPTPFRMRRLSPSRLGFPPSFVMQEVGTLFARCAFHAFSPQPFRPSRNFFCRGVAYFAGHLSRRRPELVFSVLGSSLFLSQWARVACVQARRLPEVPSFSPEAWRRYDRRQMRRAVV